MDAVLPATRTIARGVVPFQNADSLIEILIFDLATPEP
jgi:hypothetical protein